MQWRESKKKLPQIKIGKKAIVITQQIAEDYFKLQGCVLNSQYVNSKMPLKYTYNCGREATIKWHNFKSGKRCGKCKKKRSVKFTLEEVKNLFADANCEFLDDSYVNNTTPCKFKCSCGEVGSIKVQYFQRGVRCKSCKKNNRSGEKHFAWRSDRDQLNFEIGFRKRVYGFLDRCRKVFNTHKQDRSHNILDYTPSDLQHHITSHPNWELVKDTDWQLDHIFPLQAFLDYGILDFKIINCLDNLQPLSSLQNILKFNHYDRKEFLSWLESKNYPVVECVSLDMALI